MNLAKQPAKMFGDYTGLFSTAGDGQPYTSWDVYGISCSRCHGSQVTVGRLGRCATIRTFRARKSTGSTATGATRVALCMDCHRQETGGAPYDGPGTDPGGLLKVGPYHESVEFLSHWTGNLFLNSPHGNFSGTFAQINDKTFYDTHFKNEGEDWPYQGNAGGCTQCHDVHKSTVAAANPDGGAIHEECTDLPRQDARGDRAPDRARHADREQGLPERGLRLLPHARRSASVPDQRRRDLLDVPGGGADRPGQREYRSGR